MPGIASRVAETITADSAVGRSLYDKVTFIQAQGVLVGLTDCTPDRAAHALLATSFHLLLSPGDVAQSLLRAMTTEDDHDGCVLTRLAALALESDEWHQPDRVVRLDGAGRTSESSVLHVVETWDKGVPGVRACGELDLATVPDLVAAVGRAGRWPVGQSSNVAGSVSFRLDLEGITFIDLTGVRTLRSIHDGVTAKGAHLMAVAAPIAKGCRRLLDVAVPMGWLPPDFAPGLRPGA